MLLLTWLLLAWAQAFSVSSFEITNPKPGTAWNLDQNQTVAFTLDPDDNSSTFVTINFNNSKTNHLLGFYPPKGQAGSTAPLSALNGSITSSFNIGYLTDLNLFSDQWTLIATTQNSTGLLSSVSVSSISLFSIANSGRPTLGAFPAPLTVSSVTNITATPSSRGTAKLAFSLIVPILVICIFALILNVNWKFRKSPKPFHQIKYSDREISANHQNPNGAKNVARRRAMLNVFPAAFMAIFPVLALALALIILLSRHEIKSSPDRASVLSSTHVDVSDVYLLNVNSNKYLTIADWASSIAMLLPGFLMPLLWYYIARELHRFSMSDEKDNLPTPYQMGILISLRSGSFLDLCGFILYAVRRLRAKQSPLLARSGSIVMVASTLG
jgi:hypothetical protein